MANPYDKAHELARAIMESEPYKAYVEAKQIIENNPDYKSQILIFRNKQMRLNEKQMRGEDLSEDEIAQITSDYQELNQIKELVDFFNAEMSFVTLFNDIQQIIQQKIDSGLV
ncbi:MAG: YlbF family regulator [Syntrophomonadaceae bacterium]|nr:YlbF family regulator [Syntrophomonadaceae bacterium]